MSRDLWLAAVVVHNYCWSVSHPPLLLRQCSCCWRLYSGKVSWSWSLSCPADSVSSEESQLMSRDCWSWLWEAWCDGDHQWSWQTHWDTQRWCLMSPHSWSVMWEMLTVRVSDSDCLKTLAVVRLRAQQGQLQGKTSWYINVHTRLMGTEFIMFCDIK